MDTSRGFQPGEVDVFFAVEEQPESLQLTHVDSTDKLWSPAFTFGTRRPRLVDMWDALRYVRDHIAAGGGGLPDISSFFLNCTQFPPPFQIGDMCTYEVPMSFRNLGLCLTRKVQHVIVLLAGMSREDCLSPMYGEPDGETLDRFLSGTGAGEAVSELSTSENCFEYPDDWREQMGYIDRDVFPWADIVRREFMTSEWETELPCEAELGPLIARLQVNGTKKEWCVVLASVAVLHHGSGLNTKPWIDALVTARVIDPVSWGICRDFFGVMTQFPTALQLLKNVFTPAVEAPAVPDLRELGYNGDGLMGSFSIVTKTPDLVVERILQPLANIRALRVTDARQVHGAVEFRGRFDPIHKAEITGAPGLVSVYGFPGETGHEVCLEVESLRDGPMVTPGRLIRLALDLIRDPVLGLTFRVELVDKSELVSADGTARGMRRINEPRAVPGLVAMIIVRSEGAAPVNLERARGWANQAPISVRPYFRN